MLSYVLAVVFVSEPWRVRRTAILLWATPISIDTSSFLPFRPTVGAFRLKKSDNFNWGQPNRIMCDSFLPEYACHWPVGKR
jgi:hypothetical protein